MPFNPYSSYVGVKVPEGDKTWGFLQSGQSHRFNIVEVDTKGKFLQGTSNVQIQLYKLQWRWWWDASNDDVSSYNSAMANTPYFTTTILTDARGKGSFNLKTDIEEWGNYLVRVTDVEG